MSPSPAALKLPSRKSPSDVTLSTAPRRRTRGSYCRFQVVFMPCCAALHQASWIRLFVLHARKSCVVFFFFSVCCSAPVPKAVPNPFCCRNKMTPFQWMLRVVSHDLKRVIPNKHGPTERLLVLYSYLETAAGLTG